MDSFNSRLEESGMSLDSYLNWKPRMKQLTEVIKRGDKHYYVSTNDTFDHGFETMIFAFDLYSGKVTDWGELYAERYDTELAAAVGHTRAINNFQP